MDIHKPKPIHSLRELASEIGVIVLGILIALGLEQAIEYVHSRERAASASEAIKGELRQAVLVAYTTGQLADCTATQLAVLSAAAGKADQHALQQLLGKAYLPRPAAWPDAAWQAALSSDTSNLFDQRTRTAYSVLYVFVAEARIKQERYLDAYGRLRAIVDTDLADLPGAAQAESAELAEMIAARRDLEYLARAMPMSAKDQLPEAFRFTKAEYATRPFYDDEPKCRAAAAALRSPAG